MKLFDLRIYCCVLAIDIDIYLQMYMIGTCYNCRAVRVTELPHINNYTCTSIQLLHVTALQHSTWYKHTIR
jgi:hypothetical protein